VRRWKEVVGLIEGVLANDHGDVWEDLGEWGVGILGCGSDCGCLCNKCGVYVVKSFVCRYTTHKRLFHVLYSITLIGMLACCYSVTPWTLRCNFAFFFEEFWSGLTNRPYAEFGVTSVHITVRPPLLSTVEPGMYGG
jgi:hypothetical protein